MAEPHVETQNGPCEQCKYFAVGYDYTGLYYRKDVLPELPGLRASSDAGCALCRHLRQTLINEQKTVDTKADIATISIGAQIGPYIGSRPFGVVFWVHGWPDSTHPKGFCYDWFAQRPSVAIKQFRILPDPEALSSENISLIKNWINDCQERHTNCPGASLPPLPTRVIDVIARDPVLALTAGKRGRYAALSHCWGLSQENTHQDQYMTRSNSLPVRMKGMSLNAMPQTFQDAVTATRVLGLQYLWIDSLCIIQDDLSDMKQEIQNIVSIYGNATLTLSATNAANSKAGFLSRDPLPPPSVVMPFTTCSGEVGTYNMYARHEQSKGRLHLRSDWGTDVYMSGWNKRAWTFQERLVSSRVLHFSRNKLYFECRSSEATENGDPPREAMYNLPYELDSYYRSIGYFEHFSSQTSPKPSDIYRIYYILVQQYSQRKLTFRNDKESAFSAFVFQFQKLLRCEGVYGLWMSDILKGLLWMSWQDERITESSVLPEDLSGHSWPSWSWYSYTSSVMWNFGPLTWESIQGFHEVGPESSFTRVHPIRYVGHTSEAPPKLSFAAVIKEVDSVWSPRSGSNVGRNPAGAKIELEGQCLGEAWFDSPKPRHRTTICVLGNSTKPLLNKPLLYMEIFIVGLLVEQVGSGADNHFRRVGVFFSRLPVSGTDQDGNKRLAPIFLSEPRISITLI